MSEQSFLADKLRSGKPVITGWSVLCVPMIAEMMARGGYEAVTVDLQHGMYDFASACEALAATALGGAHRIVRIPIGDNALAGRLADMGAECLIAPMINSREDAVSFARAVKYPPDGDRSWSPFRAAMLSGQTMEEYRKGANSQTLSLAMIETQEAIDALDDILSVPELDGVFVGPSDLSISLSNGARLDPNGEANAKVCAAIAEKAVKAGKLAGIFCMNADKVKEAIQQGFCLISHGIDRSFVGDAIANARREVDEITST
ncbi:HpcH/HpaI aldolase family protein [Roseibium marinum]|uniref:4-hydroxy-2-oxoheptanedioate aldolase n=1 Tax=Roseibium marinum TaxID=281252 RepID=A0A2S3UKL5_9HYPH|nr:aldolase/citrate lyase family protein [Roseibium marinum]POF28103.1 4-hydroxy-2-oxoheptanedioate aldolase [Roseibium marinum]